MKEQLWQNILYVRKNSPLVHNITNYVVMNNTANALLASGASPIMAHAHEEVKSVVAISSALVINIGTLDNYWAESMLLAAEQANDLGKPWILDPVGAGATAYRNEVLAKLIMLKPDVIRGNASEIMSLANHNISGTKGVDSIHQSSEAISAAKSLHEHTGSIICVSGATDIILGNGQKVLIANGNPLMGKVTGLGCTASALIGAFIGTIPDKLEATVSAMALLGIAGEIAAENAAGPASLQLQLIDKLYNISETEFYQLLKIEIGS